MDLEVRWEKRIKRRFAEKEEKRTERKVWQEICELTSGNAKHDNHRQFISTWKMKRGGKVLDRKKRELLTSGTNGGGSSFLSNASQSTDWNQG